jgi:hypothetical protein
VKLNLFQRKFYFLIRELLEKVRSLPPEERFELILVIESLKEELNKFIKSF